MTRFFPTHKFSMAVAATAAATVIGIGLALASTGASAETLATCLCVTQEGARKLFQETSKAAAQAACSAIGGVCRSMSISTIIDSAVDGLGGVVGILPNGAAVAQFGIG